MADYGQTNAAVGANVARLRAQKRWSLREMADALPDGPGGLSHASIRELEHGLRRVTVDELTALAAALDVSPLTLLVPPTEPDFGLTGTGEPTPAVLLRWLQGRSPLQGTDDPFEVEAFQRRALPEWAETEVPTTANADTDPGEQAVDALCAWVTAIDAEARNKLGDETLDLPEQLMVSLLVDMPEARRVQVSAQSAGAIRGLLDELRGLIVVDVVDENTNKDIEDGG